MSTGTLTHPTITPVKHHYEIHGYDGSRLVQARLAEHGQLSHVTWEPGPPAWRLHYNTPLALSEVEQMLQDVIRRYDLKFYEST